jgi:hypothetical protein
MAGDFCPLSIKAWVLHRNRGGLHTLSLIYAKLISNSEAPFPMKQNRKASTTGITSTSGVVQYQHYGSRWLVLLLDVVPGNRALQVVLGTT